MQETYPNQGARRMKYILILYPRARGSLLIWTATNETISWTCGFTESNRAVSVSFTMSVGQHTSFPPCNGILPVDRIDNVPWWAPIYSLPSLVNRHPIGGDAVESFWGARLWSYSELKQGPLDFRSGWPSGPWSGMIATALESQLNLQPRIGTEQNTWVVFQISMLRSICRITHALWSWPDQSWKKSRWDYSGTDLGRRPANGAIRLGLCF
jgi:hypothetical protein